MKLTAVVVSHTSYVYISGASPPAESHQGDGLKHQHAKDSSKHQVASQPAWLLALEVVTGTLTTIVLLFAVLAAIKKCKGKYPIIIPWKKVANGNEQMIMYIGQFSNVTTTVF